MKKAKVAGPNGKCVAVRLHMDGKVTGRSIAYVAVLVRVLILGRLPPINLLSSFV